MGDYLWIVTAPSISLAFVAASGMALDFLRSLRWYDGFKATGGLFWCLTTLMYFCLLISFFSFTRGAGVEVPFAIR